MKINENLSKLDKRYHELYRRSLRDVETVLDSKHFIDCIEEDLDQFKSRLAGELNSRLRNMSTVDAVAKLRQECEKQTTIVGYYTTANVIGYGLPSDDITRVNTRYLQGERADVAKDRAERGSNYVHEKCHDMGSDHDLKRTARRSNSWAYVMGYAYKDAHRRCFPEQYGTIAKPPADQVKPIKVRRKKPWWMFWK